MGRRALDESDIRVLAPLVQLIEDTIKTTPVRMGHGGTDDLSAQLTVRVAVWVGKNVLPRTPGMAAFINDVDAARQRQLTQWGEQRHPDGTNRTGDRQRAATARLDCQSRGKQGGLTWALVLQKKVCAAYAETDPTALRRRLVQAAAVIQEWIADLDRRLAAAPCHHSAQGDTRADPKEPVQ